jgi:hypothetical protein
MSITAFDPIGRDVAVGHQSNPAIDESFRFDRSVRSTTRQQAVHDVLERPWLEQGEPDAHSHEHDC